MEKAKSNKKATIIAVVVLVVLAAVFYSVYQLTKAPASEGDKSITVEVVLTDGSSEDFKIDTDAEYLREALEEKSLIEGTESEYGLYVLTVNGVTADDANQEWWCFTKSDESLTTGVDDTPIENGDHFEITLTVGY